MDRRIRLSVRLSAKLPAEHLAGLNTTDWRGLSTLLAVDGHYEAATASLKAGVDGPAVMSVGLGVLVRGCWLCTGRPKGRIRSGAECDPLRWPAGRDGRVSPGDELSPRTRGILARGRGLGRRSTPARPLNCVRF